MIVYVVKNIEDETISRICKFENNAQYFAAKINEQKGYPIVTVDTYFVDTDEVFSGAVKGIYIEIDNKKNICTVQESIMMERRIGMVWEVPGYGKGWMHYATFVTEEEAENLDEESFNKLFDGYVETIEK